MKKAFLVLMVLFISFQINAQWVSQTSGVTGNLVSVSAVDDNICWISGEAGKVLRTTNGGTTWTNVGGGAVIGTTNTVDNLYALDANTCLASAYSGSGAFVYKTTNGGSSWTQVFIQYSGFIDAIHMTSPTNGFMYGDPVGLRWSLFKTTDGGTTWDSSGLNLAQVGTEAGWNNSMFVNGSNIWFGTNNSKIYYSTNNGATWTGQSTPPLLNVNSVWFSGSTGIACGTTAANAGAISITTNNGTTWTAGPFMGSGSTTGIIQGNNVLYATLTGAIYLSTNGGILFSKVDSVSGNIYYNVGIARTGTTIWACAGATGQIRKGSFRIPASHLQLWVKADSGAVLNGAKVSRWTDLSGNGNDAIQSDTSRQPLLISNGLNQKPVLRFDGVNDRLGLTGTKLMSQIHLFIVEMPVQGATGPNPYYPIVLGDNDNDYGLSMQNSFSNNSPDEIDPFTSDQSWVRANAPGISAFGQWKIISVTADKNMYNTTLRANGVDAIIAPQGTINSALSIPLGNSTGTGHGGIGCADNEPAGRLIFKGDIAEVIVYDTLLSNTDRLEVEKYLNDKYQVITGVKENNFVPEKISLEQNYPNPFNPSTTIKYSIAKSGLVKITVYNALGQKVSDLVNEVKQAGSYNVSFNAFSISSGIYFYRIETQQFSQVKKMIVLK